MPPTPRTNLRGSVSQFFRRAGPQHAFKNFSGTPRSVYCLNLSPVRRLQLDKTPKKRNAKNRKNGELRTAVYPPRMAPFVLKLGQNAFQAIPNISHFDLQNHNCLQISCSEMHESLARTYVSWVRTHVSWAKTHVSWSKTQDTCVLA